MRVGEVSCGFKSALSLVSCPGLESSCTPLKSCFYDAGETMRPLSEWGSDADDFDLGHARRSATPALRRTRPAYRASGRRPGHSRRPGFSNRTSRRRPTVRPVEGLPLLLEQRLKASRAAEPSVASSIWPGISAAGVPGPSGIFEGEGRGETHRANERERSLEIGVGFARIADDEIGRESDVRPRGAHARDDVEIIGDAMATVHRREHAVRAGLNGQMQIGRQRFERRDGRR